VYTMKKRVVGFGGVFFKSPNQKTLLAWYEEHLGIDVLPWGGAVFKEENTTTAWAIKDASSTEFAGAFQINYRVEDLKTLLNELRSEGVNVLDEYIESEFGNFGYCLDPDGNKIELWEPANVKK
jgi:predicted enzyme related to lactoylglutathione lyase